MTKLYGKTPKNRREQPKDPRTTKKYQTNSSTQDSYAPPLFWLPPTPRETRLEWETQNPNPTGVDPNRNQKPENQTKKGHLSAFEGKASKETRQSPCKSLERIGKPSMYAVGIVLTRSLSADYESMGRYA